MGKGVLKYGGKSGILPKTRPIFKKNPIRAPNELEKQEKAQIVQGYAEGIPEPKKVKVSRIPIEKPVITVQQRIEKVIDEKSKLDQERLSKIANPSDEQIWEMKKREIRRAYLKEAYLEEEKRLKKIDELKLKEAEKKKQESAGETEYEESEATKLTIPTIESYLLGPIMRPRTKEETEIVNAQRKANRMRHQLKVDESKAEEVLELYHTSSGFITTEQELEKAIKEAFEVNIGGFESKQMAIENKISGHSNAFTLQSVNEDLIMDHALGDIQGKPGLEVIESNISGEIEKLRLEAQAVINQGRTNVNSN